MADARKLADSAREAEIWSVKSRKSCTTFIKNTINILPAKKDMNVHCCFVLIFRGKKWMHILLNYTVQLYSETTQNLHVDIWSIAHYLKMRTSPIYFCFYSLSYYSFESRVCKLSYDRQLWKSISAHEIPPRPLLCRKEGQHCILRPIWRSA